MPFTPDQKALLLRNFSDLERARRRGELVDEVRKKMGLKPILYAGEERGPRKEEEDAPRKVTYGWWEPVEPRPGWARHSNTPDPPPTIECVKVLRASMKDDLDYE